ncbi:hypothetical protein [Nocardioides panaciterrulae]|uniref:Zinc-finger domain-containing protein n=1 Tax=Nocardioides panaciterrulae TaxID=661492 RepID=A0A7Y9JD08_9ACTN|nr:hypothetical protein [Nocardioides panaciterrulae]NYD42804.1 hypothetical protein [Nocardioides panaciterrulae]
MIGHLGSRVSALLDGQLSPEETERAWSHVHTCHLCRDLIEREGWVKTRLAGLSVGSAHAPAHLKGSLLGGGGGAGGGGLAVAADVFLEDHRPAGTRRTAGLAALGGGALGAAVMGVLVLGVGPAQAPTMEQRAPVSQLNPPTARLVAPVPSPVPSRVPSRMPSVGASATPAAHSSRAAR